MRVSITLALLLLGSTTYSQAESLRPGAKCSQAGKQITVNKSYLKCKKTNGKLVWTRYFKKAPIENKQISKPTPSATPTPSASPSQIKNFDTNAYPSPQSWQDLVEKFKGVPGSALKVSENKQKEKLGNSPATIIFIGPNTKLNFQDTEGNILKVTNLYPSFETVKKLYFIYYNISDMNWATNKFEEILGSDADNVKKNAGNKPAEKNCLPYATECRGALAITGPSMTGYVLFGVASPENQNNYGFIAYTSGAGEAHEYFHTLQDVAMFDKDWRNFPRWWIEGGATWVQNAALNGGNYENYLKTRESIIENLHDNSDQYTKQWVSEFLDLSNYEKNWWDNYEGWRVYDVGYLAIEAMVSLRGINPTLDVFKNVSQTKTFEMTFKEAMGISWEDAKDYLAEYISKTIKFRF